MTRKDIHRPADFDPADYRVVDYLDNRKPEPPPVLTPGAIEAWERYVALWQERIFEHFPDWRTDGGDHHSIHQCNHCGHPGIRWVAVVEHIPTGGKLAFGEICADRVELPGRDAFRAKFIKDRAQLEAAQLANELADATFDAENPGLRAYLFEHEHDEFLGSLYRQLNRKHELSEKQILAANRSRNREAEYQERIAAEREALRDAPALPEGRRPIEGEVVSVKLHESPFGDQWKMLVREADGNKVFGTAPQALIDDWMQMQEDEHADRPWTTVARGTHVALTATVERSDKDEHFGFYKRPTGATLVGQEVR